MESKPKWLDYAGQSTSELIDLAGEYRIDSIVCAFEQAIGQKEDSSTQSEISSEERTVLAIEALEREVNNGGYDQFFRNLSREYVPVIVRELQRIGCTEAAALTQRAIDILAIQGGLTHGAIAAAMAEEDDSRAEKLGECDDAYYSSIGDLAGPLFEFIKTNRTRIVIG